MCTYEYQPPYGELAFSSRCLFGIVSALTERGLDVLECWLNGNPDLKVCLIVLVYPACPTRQADLLRLLQTVERLGDKLSVYVRPLERITDRGTNALCFLTRDSEVSHRHWAERGPRSGPSAKRANQFHFPSSGLLLCKNDHRTPFRWAPIPDLMAYVAHSC
jgi:hypothetical protein